LTDLEPPSPPPPDAFKRTGRKKPTTCMSSTAEMEEGNKDRICLTST
jgi:hypothetical protein